MCAASITPESINWIWPNWLAAGKLHILAGAPGTGKTTIAMDFAASIANGGFNGNCWPDKSFALSGSVVIWTGEDGIADTIIPRLQASGNNLNRIFIVGQTKKNGRSRPFDPATDLALLQEEIRKIGNVRLVIIDPIVMVVGGDSHKNVDVRKALAPLVEMGEKYGCAILGITHVTKSSKGKDPLDRIVGSMGFTAVARIVMLTAKIKSDSPDGGPSRCVLVRAKSNIGRDEGGFIYHIDPVDFQTNKGQIFTSRICWDEIPIQGTTSEILQYAEGNSDNGASDKLGEAIDFLKMILANGPIPYPDIESQALQNGISKATIRRAKLKHGIQHFKQPGMGAVSPSMWTLPMPPAAQWQNNVFQRSCFDRVASVAPVAPVASVASAAPVASVANETGDKVDEDIWQFCIQQCKQRFAECQINHEWADKDDSDVLDKIDKIIEEVVDLAFSCGSATDMALKKAEYKSHLRATSWWS